MLNRVPKIHKRRGQNLSNSRQVLKVEIKKFKVQNFGPNYTINRKRDAHCEFHQHQSMVRCSKLGERYRTLWHQSRKWGTTSNLQQKCTIENYEKNMQRKFSQKRIMVKCSKLGEKYRELWEIDTWVENEGWWLISDRNIQ